MIDEYKVKVLKDNIVEMAKDEFYKVRLKGEKGKAINLDAGAIMLLISYYQGRR